MTAKEFEQLLIRLNPNIKLLLSQGAHNRTSALRATVVELWMNQTPENDDTQTLRKELKHLDKHGFFSFKGDT